ncbi:MAG: GAF domain-containing protein [Flavobacteriaceae bacterium]|nr:GAF domain-containing protein [Flavobacteriaceae bacterium]
MKTENQDFPFKVKFSFESLLEKYDELAKNKDNESIASHAKHVLSKTEAYPELRKGFEDITILEKYKEPVEVLFNEMFPIALGDNEIKGIMVPFTDGLLHTSPRLKKIIKDAGIDFSLKLRKFSDDEYYIMGCCMILGFYYNYKIDFRRPLFYDIPDINGMMRSYKVLFNGDFSRYTPTERAIDIKQEDVNILIDNFENIDVWKEKFPVNSWIYEGLGLAIFYDATIDVAISKLKSNLINIRKKDTKDPEEMNNIFRAIYNISSIKIGFTQYDSSQRIFNKPEESLTDSYILNNNEPSDLNDVFCESTINYILELRKNIAISDLDNFKEGCKDALYIKNLKAKGIKSCILAPIYTSDVLLGVLEIVSENKGDLNSINASKLDDILPFLRDSLERVKQEKNNEISALIQKECTSIHPSLLWKFEEKANNILMNKIRGHENIPFKDIVFKNVIPLYGQIDVKGSSLARNTAVTRDFSNQLSKIEIIITKAIKESNILVLEELKFRINNYKKTLKNKLDSNLEQHIINFLKNEINDILLHLEKTNPSLVNIIEDYRSETDNGNGVFYYNLKKYDETIMLINKTMADILDKRQVEAQKIYPHYFERYKTDGVDHNIYIGESMVKNLPFNKIYIDNLRLWQLEVMCEMEKSFIDLKPKLQTDVEVSSLLLVYNTPLSIRFRIDEKHFDVDGAYNARYEIIKKRIDKANIKGTNQRLTQPGKIAIVYSTKQDELEYMRYVKFLQLKNIVSNKTEIVEIEDLQGVTGLQALIVSLV